MPKNKVGDLRNLLFEQIENLRDAKTEDLQHAIKRAQAIVDIAAAITETAKVEVQLVTAMAGTLPSEFFELSDDDSLIARKALQKKIGDGKLDNARMPWPKGYTDAGMIGLERKHG